MARPFVLYQLDSVTSFVDNGWELFPHGRFAWLHRLLWWWLQHMGAVTTHYKEEIKLIRFPCDENGVLAKIMESNIGLLKRFHEPKEILIGPNTLSELLNLPELRDWNSPFCMEASGGRSFNGLRITVLPQMEGVLVR